MALGNFHSILDEVPVRILLAWISAIRRFLIVSQTVFVRIQKQVSRN